MQTRQTIQIYIFSTLCMLGKNFNRWHSKTYFLFFLENRIFQILFCRKNKKYIISLYYAEFASSMVRLSVKHYKNLDFYIYILSQEDKRSHQQIFYFFLFLHKKQVLDMKITLRHAFIELQYTLLTLFYFFLISPQKHAVGCMYSCCRLLWAQHHLHWTSCQWWIAVQRKPCWRQGPCVSTQKWKIC